MLVVIQINQLTFLIVILIIVITVILLLYKFLSVRKSINSLKYEIALLQKENLELIATNEKSDEIDKLRFSYLTDISHQIRTHSNAIIGFSEFLAINNLNESDRKNYSQVIKYNNELLLKIIDDILDISLIENNQFKFKRETISLHKLIEETYLLFKENQKIKKAHIDFTYYIDDNRTDLEIISDSFRLKQILANLIDNAIKFTDSGQISFTYKIIEMDNRKFVKFQVDDSGIGIDNKYQNKIFDRFFRITSDNNHLYKGSGIGLSMVKSLVNIMGGDVWYKSIPNNGSTFFFTIPFIENKNDIS